MLSLQSAQNKHFKDTSDLYSAFCLCFFWFLQSGLLSDQLGLYSFPRRPFFYQTTTNCSLSSSVVYLCSGKLHGHFFPCQYISDADEICTSCVQSKLPGKRGSMYVSNETSQRQSMYDPAKRASMYHGSGGVKSENSFGSGATGGDVASLRRDLGAKEQRAADAEKARDKSERALENIKTELAGEIESVIETMVFKGLKKEFRGLTRADACTFVQGSYFMAD